MQSLIEKALQELPSRARVGLGLASAERAVAVLKSYPDVDSLARHGLEEAWLWVNGADVKSLDLYHQIDPLAFASTDLVTGTTYHNAALSVISALYYATGEIATYETPEDPHQLYSPLGSDMADVGSEDLVECLERATDSTAGSETEAQWQQALMDHLLSDFQTDDPDQVGPPISRAYFLIS